MMNVMERRQVVSRPTLSWQAERVVYHPGNLGINYYAMHQHGGSDPHHWLTTPYDVAKVEGDLALLASLGIRLLRVWAPAESVIDLSGTEATGLTPFAPNLLDFLTRCTAYRLRVLLVMADGHAHQRSSPPYDAKFMWQLIRSPEGRRRYADAYRAYVRLVAPLDNVFCWEIANEPYGNLTWALYPQLLGITMDQVHDYLLVTYHALKAIVTQPVGFSDLEEQEQPKYRMFSDATLRQTYVDDCTDYYSMHIYRAGAHQMADFRALTAKPKYLTEVGHYNYEDPTGEFHAGQPARLELQHEQLNKQAVIELNMKALNSGFEFVMPWDMSDNPGMFIHHPDGSHTVKALPRWMQNVLLAHVRTSQFP